VGTTSIPSFLSMTLTTTPLSRSGGGTGLSTVPSAGQILIGNTATGNLILSTITGTANQIIVTNGAGTITLSTPQNIATTSSPTFGSLTLSGGALARSSGGTGVQAVTTNGQVLIGLGGAGGYALGSISGTANQIVVTPGAGTITLSLATLVSAGSCGGGFLNCNTDLDATGRVINYRNDPSPIFATTATATTAGCFAFNASIYWMKTKVATGATGTWAVRMQIVQTSSSSATNTAGCSIQINGVIPSGFQPNLPVAYPVMITVGVGIYELGEVRILAANTNILITPVYAVGGSGLLQGSSLQGWPLDNTSFQIGNIVVLYTTQEV